MDMTDTIFKPICILMVIIDRRRSQQLQQVLARLSLSHTLCSLAEGTANHEIFDYLGLDITHKLIIATPVIWEDAPAVIQAISDEMELSKPGRGIAFTIPVSGVAGSLAMDILMK